MRCFLAIELSEEIVEELENLKKNFKIEGIKLVERENLHITVKFLGEVEEKTVEEIKNIDLSMEPVESRIKGLGVFPRENYIRVIWVGASNLVPLFKEVDRKLEDLNFRREREYIPHVTIGRVKFLRNRKLLKERIEKYRDVDIGTQYVESIVLMRSILTRGGPIYEVLKRWDF
ncbi:MAG TPA: RNA 2',3'-cyclic phosphodiesterase [Methanothermococcus okinawensis]|uniref:RNA 2',3'-cyclic phosphodiesterase n=1 Tax=Methanothermococcus okinawensis TaxID=155863 RepID=A0A832ZBZ1_9EURY|nr:RNA 2',3'-cyclic phosphodiesterase [Methanococcaceae archaeon]HIP84114.1 RNA 2',3'-cyclic phosphodiesterase [Methanothermococcus okinawensis]HIP91660.1 RNA 2',3'-cyclic phosphodiesterase [Methanothermococcus okinawensis]